MTGELRPLKETEFPHLFITEESNVTFLFALLSADTLL